jgi:hypothetical protein
MTPANYINYDNLIYSNEHITANVASVCCPINIQIYQDNSTFLPTTTYKFDAIKALKEHEILQKFVELQKKNKMYRIAHNHSLKISELYECPKIN